MVKKVGAERYFINGVESAGEKVGEGWGKGWGRVGEGLGNG